MYSDILYQKDFITLEQENEISKIIPRELSNQDKLLYSIYRFGKYVHPYNTNKISDEIPEILMKLNVGVEFDSVTINEFEKGQNIGFHYDSFHAGDKIAVLSLFGNSELTFRNTKGDVKKFTIEPKSLYVIEGDLRTKWQHSSIALDYRISVVFRKSIPK